MKIVLEYDPISGLVSDKDGAPISYFHGLGEYELKEEAKSIGGSITDLMQLKSVGFLLMI